MKKLILTLMAAVVVFGACSLAVTAENAPPVRTIAYYFHGSVRCYTCNLMEKYSKEAIGTNFKDALANGVLEFRSVNVEDPGNEHFVDDYGLYTKSLILSMEKDGKEVKSKSLDKIWEYARNRQRFVDYVTGEIAGFMKDAE